MPTRISLLWTVVLLTLPCPLFLVIGIAALVVLSLLPIYFLDCMDGQGLTRCSLPMIVRAGFTAGRQCGDLDW